MGVRVPPSACVAHETPRETIVWWMEASGVVIRHPNREKGSSKTTKVAIVVLLLASAVLIGLVTFGGWEKLGGAQIIAVFYVLLYVVMAYFVARWKRGVLAMAGALALLFASMALVAVPAWFARDKSGFVDAAFPAGVLGFLTILVVVVQALLVIFALVGFRQEWNIEVEERPKGDEQRHAQDSDEDSETEDAEQSTRA